MAIVRKKLGNNPKIMQEKFRSHFSDGLGGIRYGAFCVGWGEGFTEAKHKLQAENKRLEVSLKIAVGYIKNPRNRTREGKLKDIETGHY